MFNRFSMGNDKRYQRQLRVQMKYVPAPNADDTLFRVLSILLRAARRAATSEEGTNAKKEQSPSRAPEKNTPTGGIEESKAHEST